MEPASKHLLTNLSIDKEARLEFPTTLFPSTFNILEVKKTINSTLTWDPILGPFFISSLTAIAQNELTAKIKKYCTCFFDMCCSPQQEAIEQQNIEAQLDRNDNILKDIDISLNSHNKGLPSSFFPVEVINSAKKSIEVEPQAILNAYKQYFLFRQRFPNEETWKKGWTSHRRE